MKETKYFKTYTEAHEAASSVDPRLCINKYQTLGDTQKAKVVSFVKGYAVQLGDCGEYLTK